MKLRGLLPLSEETPGAPTYANRSEELSHPVLKQNLARPLECPLQFALKAWAGFYLDTGLPTRQCPPLGSTG